MGYTFMVSCVHIWISAWERDKTSTRDTYTLFYRKEWEVFKPELLEIKGWYWQKNKSLWASFVCELSFYQWEHEALEQATSIVCTCNLTNSKMEAHISRERIYVLPFSGLKAPLQLFLKVLRSSSVGLLCCQILSWTTSIHHYPTTLSIPHLPLINPNLLTSYQLHWWELASAFSALSLEEGCSISQALAFADDKSSSSSVFRQQPLLQNYLCLFVVCCKCLRKSRNLLHCVKQYFSEQRSAIFSA